MMKLNSIRKRIAGKKAQNIGKHFEFLFEAACRKNSVTCIPIPDGCETKGFDPRINSNRLVRVKTPFDYILKRKNNLAFVDTKTVAGNSFCYSDLSDHQTDALFQLSESAACGLVIWFRELDEVYFVSIDLIRALKPRESIRPSDHKKADDSFRYLGRSGDFDPSILF